MPLPVLTGLPKGSSCAKKKKKTHYWHLATHCLKTKKLHVKKKIILCTKKKLSIWHLATVQNKKKMRENKTNSLFASSRAHICHIIIHICHIILHVCHSPSLFASSRAPCRSQKGYAVWGFVRASGVAVCGNSVGIPGVCLYRFRYRQSFLRIQV